MTDSKAALRAEWQGGPKGNGTLKGRHLDTQIAATPSVGGSGDGADPKELLISSVTACYVATLVFMLDSRKLSVAALSVDANADFSNDPHVDLKPFVTLASGAGKEEIALAEKLIKGAEAGCKIGNLLKKAGVAIRIDGVVHVE